MASIGGGLMEKVTRIEFDHETKIFTIIEDDSDSKKTYTACNIWRVIQKLQNLVEEKGGG